MIIKVTSLAFQNHQTVKALNRILSPCGEKVKLSMNIFIAFGDNLIYASDEINGSGGIMSETADWRPFSEVIKDFRERHNLTLEELSRMVGIPAQTLNRYELGQRAPKVSVVQEMAFKLGVNPMWFMGYDRDDEFNAANMHDLPPNRISNFGVYSLSEKEKDLVLRFRKLTCQGQEKLLAYATDLTRIPMYMDPKEYDRVLDHP